MDGLGAAADETGIEERPPTTRHERRRQSGGDRSSRFREVGCKRPGGQLAFGGDRSAGAAEQRLEQAEHTAPTR